MYQYTDIQKQLPYGGKLWWRENLANSLQKHIWGKKIWQILSILTPKIMRTTYVIPDVSYPGSVTQA